MDLSNLLSWLGGTILLMVLVQALGAWTRDRGRTVLRVVAIGVICLVVALYAPDLTGYIMALLILMLLIGPPLVRTRALRAFELQAYRRALRWVEVMALLFPSQPMRASMRLFRAQVAYHLDPDRAEETLAQGLDATQQALLHLHILSCECRWTEVHAALEALPVESRSSLPLLSLAMRERYEAGDFLAVVAAYRECRRVAPAHPPQRWMRLADLFILGITGNREPLQALLTRTPLSPDDRDTCEAIAEWASGQEAVARSLLARLVSAEDHRVRLRASFRLAHPPPLASELPPDLHQLAAEIIAGVPSARARHPAVSTMLALNVAMYVTTLVLAMSLSAGTGNNAFEAAYDQALSLLGAFSVGAVAHDHEFWRLGSALFLHGGFLHIGMNMLGLMMIGPPLERRLGWRRFVALYLVAGLVGNLVFWLAASLQAHDALLIGASGCIMGIVGGLLCEAWVEYRAGRQSTERLRMIGLQIVLQCGFDAMHPQVAASAHIGGLLSGFLLALLFLRHSPPVATPASESR